MATETARERDATPAGPNTMVIFGAGGDLTMRKLVPALYHLARYKLLSDAFAIVGFGGRDYDDEAFRTHLRGQVAQHIDGDLDSDLWEWLAARAHYVQGKLGAHWRL